MNFGRMDGQGDARAGVTKLRGPKKSQQLRQERPIRRQILTLEATNGNTEHTRSSTCLTILRLSDPNLLEITLRSGFDIIVHPI